MCTLITLGLVILVNFWRSWVTILGMSLLLIPAFGILYMLIVDIRTYWGKSSGKGGEAVGETTCPLCGEYVTRKMKRCPDCGAEFEPEKE
jgi:hypothetical protein